MKNQMDCAVSSYAFMERIQSWTDDIILVRGLGCRKIKILYDNYWKYTQKNLW
jgi:hypothetical protein